MKRAFHILVAFICGQSVQVFLQFISDVLTIEQPVRVCISGGVIIAAAVLIGILLAQDGAALITDPIIEVFNDEDQTD